MGWTGDIAVFAETATLNRDVSAFMGNWLAMLRLDQRDNGTIPVVIPENRTYEPTPFKIPTAIWGDAAVMVPYAVYRAYGDREMLEKQYESMRTYALAVEKAAARGKRDDRRYLWDNNIFQYGDWCAPGEGVSKWKKKGKYLGPMFFYHTVRILEFAAGELGKEKDRKYFEDLRKNIKAAFAKYCIRGGGRLIGDFQSAYACALYFGLISDEKKAAVAGRLADMVREKNYTVQTGFAGTPYTAFALADNGYPDEAYRLLLNEECPGWLYTAKAGGTTVWERWDALDADGHFQAQGSIADMVSFNHYAYGAIGAFYYRRILGIEPLSAGYSRTRIAPVYTDRLSYAKGSLVTPHGKVAVEWKKEEGGFSLSVTVPQGMTCFVETGKGTVAECTEGEHSFSIVK
jgi:alpha-L-rhamnosidase